MMHNVFFHTNNTFLKLIFKGKSQMISILFLNPLFRFFNVIFSYIIWTVDVHKKYQKTLFWEEDQVLIIHI